MLTCRVALLRLAALAFFVVSGAASAAPRKASAENIAFDLGGAHVRIARIDAEDTDATAQDLAQLFAPGDQSLLEARLAKFAAARVSIPEIAIEKGEGAAAQKIVYRDLTLTRVAAGRIAEARAASLDQSAAAPQGKRVDAHYEGLTAKGLDIARMIRLMTASRGDDAEKLQPIEDEVAVESGVITQPEAQLEARLGRMTARGVRARALASGWARLADPQEVQGDAGAALLADALTGFEFDALEARDISLAGVAGPQHKAFSVKFGAVAASHFVNGALGELSVSDFALSSADGGTASLRRLLLRGLDARSMAEAQGRRFWRVDHTEVADLAMDTPDADSGGRMKFTLAASSADFSGFREGLPTKVKGRFDGLVIDLAARGETPGAASALALGYRTLDLSGGFDAVWREKEEELSVNELRLEGKDMGALRLTALFGGVSGAVFSANPTLARAASLIVTLRSFGVDVERASLLDRALAEEARTRGVNALQLREDYARTASGALVAYFGDTEKSQRIGAALSQFILNPQRLRLRAASRLGVGALEAMARKPGDVLNDLDIEAQAN